MHRDDRLMPVAIQANARFKAHALIREGYMQSVATVRCPDCALIFHLLLDPRDRQEEMDPESSRLAIMLYFLEKIGEDHLMNHGRERFVMM